MNGYFKNAGLEIAALSTSFGLWGGIRRSTDSGSTWSSTVASGGTFGSGEMTNVVEYNNKLFMGSTATYATSTNNGANWTLGGFFFQYGCRFVLHGDSIFRFDFLNNEGRSILRSSGPATTWRQTETGLPVGNGNPDGGKFAGLYSVNGKLLCYVTASNPAVEGLYELNMTNLSWTLIPNTSGVSVMMPFLAFRDGDYYGGTHGASMVKTGTVTGIPGFADEKIPVQLYPNPARSFVCIKGSTPTEGPLQVSILNAQGAHCVQMEVNSGENVPVEKLPRGLYWVQIQSKTSVQTQKLILE